MTSIFEGQPPKTMPFPIKTRVIWVPGIYRWWFQVLFIFIPKIGEDFQFDYIICFKGGETTN